MVRRAFVIFIYIFTLNYFLLGLTGCESIQTVFQGAKYKQDFSKANDLDLRVKINDHFYNGVGVVPRADKYEVTIYPNNNTKRIRVRTCHRKLIINEPSKGWLSSGYKIDFDPDTSRVDDFVTAKEVEDIQSCLMRISALDKSDEEHAEGIFDFLDARPEVSLDGVRVQCNGKDHYPKNGCEVCKAPVDTFQRVVMPSKAIFRTTPDCKNTINSSDDINFFLTPNPGVCQYYFNTVEKADNGKFKKFRLTVYGIVKYPFKGE